MSAVEVVDAYLAGIPGGARRLGHAEWGLRVESEAAGGAPLDVGVRIADGLLRAQAFAIPAQPGIDPWLFLHWNRQTRLARFGSARSGDVWVHADVPVAALDKDAVDRLLGLVVQGAVRAREYAAAAAAGVGGGGPSAGGPGGAPTATPPAGD